MNKWTGAKKKGWKAGKRLHSSALSVKVTPPTESSTDSENDGAKGCCCGVWKKTTKKKEKETGQRKEHWSEGSSINGSEETSPTESYISVGFGSEFSASCSSISSSLPANLTTCSQPSNYTTCSHDMSSISSNTNCSCNETDSANASDYTLLKDNSETEM